jgi:hypothetical protein
MTQINQIRSHHPLSYYSSTAEIFLASRQTFSTLEFQRLSLVFDGAQFVPARGNYDPKR